MKDGRNYKLLVVGLVVGALIGLAVGAYRPWTGPEWIAFPDKHIMHFPLPGNSWATITGRLNDRPGYPNNAVQITCREQLRSCQMVKVEEIDQPDHHRGSWPQLGDLDPAELFNVSNWDKNALTAVDDDLCEKRTLNVDFTASQAEIVVEPQNLSDMNCRGTNPTITRYPIEDAMDIFGTKKQ